MSHDVKFGGLSIAYDTAVPGGPQDVEKTLVILHGFTFHSGIFTRLLPLASENSCRVLLVNRRGYPGAELHSEEDWGLIRLAQNATPEGADAMTRFMRDRGSEVHAFLADFIKLSEYPVKKNSIIVVGWSFAASSIIAMLAHAASFPDRGVDVSSYLRRVITYDPTYFALGMNTSPIKYQPLYDDGLPAPERPAAFLRWVSGYFNHPDIEHYKFEEKVPLDDPPSTLTTISPDELMKLSFLGPVEDDGQDTMLLGPSVIHDSVRANVRDALAGKGWANVEWRFVWCDMSACHMPCGYVFVREQSDAAQAESRKGRTINFVRWRGANHFAHWDKPVQTLKALLADDPTEYNFL